MSAIAPIKSLVFIDAAVVDYQSLIDGLVVGTEAIVLDPAQDGVEQMTATLASRSDIQSVHIVSHGSSGSLQLGAATLNGASLDRYQAQLQGWRSALRDDADILLYGCDVAADALGQVFVQHLSQVTGADLAASTDLTGSAALGGDWELEYTTGNIQAADPFQVGVKEAYCHTLITFQVINTNDSGAGSLRQAILDANSNAGADLIIFDGAAFTTDDVVATITLTSGELTINGDVTIQGNGSEALSISGNNDSRVFNISGGNVTINSLTVTNGRSTGNGAGIIQTGGTTRINSSVIRNNDATGSTVGGGIAQIGGSLTLDGSTISNNIGGDTGGGGIYNSGTLVLLNSTVSNNSTGSGGGLFIEGVTTIANSTISGNRSNFEGGGIFNGLNSPLTIINSTITDNTADFGNTNSGTGGGIFRGSGTVTIRNTIIAGNFDTPGNAGAGSTARDVSGAFVDGGSNLIGSADGSTGFTVGALVGTNASSVDPVLGALANNGGITQTHALNTGSPAIDTGANANQPLDLTDIDGDGDTSEFIPVDQQGLLRASGIVDIGAFESGTGAPSNDNFDNRFLIPDNTPAFTVKGSNTNSVNEVGDPKGTNNTVWWSWTAPTSGSYRVDTNGSTNSDTYLHIYTGSVLTALTQISLDDDSGIGLDSLLTLTAVAGTTYQIAIRGFSAGSRGGLVLNVRPLVLNTSPVLSDTIVAFNAVNEDLGAPIGAVGTLVSQLAALVGGGGQDNVTDPDTGAVTGIAVTAVDTTNGTWFYSIDNGVNWLSLGTVSNTNALLLTADADTRLYFQPNVNYDGSIANAITFQAWDTTTDTNGGTADASINGGTTAFSTATDTASIAINPINDAPALTVNATLTAVNEDTIAPVGATIATLFNTQFSDIDTGSSFSGVAVVGNTAPTTDGAWEYSTDSGANWSAIATVTDGATALALSAATLVRFLPAANYNGTPTSLTIRALDDTYAGTFTSGTTRVNVDTTTNGGITAIAAVINTLGTTITSVNDAPVLTGSATLTTINEDVSNAANIGTKVSTLISGVTITDVDGDPKAIAITGVDNTKGTWQYSTDGGTTWTPITTTTDSNATLLGATSFYSANLGTAPSSQAWLGYTAVTIPPAGLPTLASGTEATSANGALVTTTADQEIYAGYSNYDTSGTLINAASPTLNATTGYSVSFDLQVLADSNTNANRAGFSILLVSQDPTKAIELAFQRLSPTTGTIFAQDSSFVAVPSETVSFNTNQKIDYRVEVSGTTYKLFANNTEIIAGILRDYAAFTPPTNFPFDPYEKPSLIFLGDDTTSAQGTFNLSQVVVQTDNRVRFVPNANANGSSTIDFRAWDTTGGGAAGAIVDASGNGGITPFSSNNATATITVNPINDAPIVATALIDQAATEDAPFTFAVPANSFTDVDTGDTLTYTATLVDGITPLPSWLTFNPATQTFSGTPTHAEVGSLDVKVTATDTGSLAASDTFTITVANTNDAPIVATPIADQAATEDAPFTFAVPANSFTDIDAGDTLTYTATLGDGTTPLPSWLSFNAATQTFSGTPTNAEVGSLDVKVTATDTGSSSANDTFTLTIANTNDAPVMATALLDQAATEDAPFTFTVPANSFTDVDTGDTLTYTATLVDGITPLPSWLTFNAATQTFSGTPTHAEVGSLDVKVTATDTGSVAASDTFTITIANTNDAPTVTTPIADQAATEDAPFTFAVPANSFADIDAGDTLTYTATLVDGITPLPSWLTFNPATQTFSGTPTNAEVGSLDVKVTATDTGSVAASDTFTITIANTNDAPTVTTPIADQAATEDAPFTFAVPTNSLTDIDISDTLTYTATLANGTALPLWLTFNPTNQTFSGTPANADIGSLDIEVTAEDTANATAEDTFTLTVAYFNDAPTLDNAIADQQATEDTLLTFAVPPNTFSDTDPGDILTYTATQADDTPLPSWLTFDATNQTFSGTPLNAEVGSLNVKVKVTDTGLLTAEDLFKIDVANTNDAPTLTNAIADQTINEDALLTFALPTNTFTDVDAGDTLTYTATLANGSALPVWLTFNPATRLFSGTPRNANVGNLDVKVNATDAAGTKAEDTFTVKVININQSPVIGTPITPIPQQLTATQPFTLKIPVGAFTDPDVGDSLIFSASLENGAPLPPWLIFDTKTGSFSGIPDFLSVGNLSLKVNATDAQGSKISQLVRLAIANPIGITGTSTEVIDFSGGKPGVTRKAKKGQPLRGTYRDDVLKGTKGNDRINSGRRIASYGRDKLFGLDGNDRLKAGGANDYLDGGRGDDFLQGGRGRDLLLGGDGNDRMAGGDGRDILIGGNGTDILAGGNGADMFAFASVNEGKDAIVDFNPAEDLIDLRSLFAQVQFAGATPYVRYLKYVQMTQVGANAEIKIDADGMGIGNTFTTLATLNNTGIGAVGSRNFVIS